MDESYTSPSPGIDDPNDSDFNPEEDEQMEREEKKKRRARKAKRKKRKEVKRKKRGKKHSRSVQRPQKRRPRKRNEREYDGDSSSSPSKRRKRNRTTSAERERELLRKQVAEQQAMIDSLQSAKKAEDDGDDTDSEDDQPNNNRRRSKSTGNCRPFDKRKNRKSDDDEDDRGGRRYSTQSILHPVRRYSQQWNVSTDNNAKKQGGRKRGASKGRRRRCDSTKDVDSSPLDAVQRIFEKLTVFPTKQQKMWDLKETESRDSQWNHWDATIPEEPPFDAPLSDSPLTPPDDAQQIDQQYERDQQYQQSLERVRTEYQTNNRSGWGGVRVPESTRTPRRARKSARDQPKPKAVSNQNVLRNQDCLEPLQNTQEIVSDDNLPLCGHQSEASGSCKSYIEISATSASDTGKCDNTNVKGQGTFDSLLDLSQVTSDLAKETAKNMSAHMTRARLRSLNEAWIPSHHIKINHLLLKSYPMLSTMQMEAYRICGRICIFDSNWEDQEIRELVIFQKRLGKEETLLNHNLVLVDFEQIVEKECGKLFGLDATIRALFRLIMCNNQSDLRFRKRANIDRLHEWLNVNRKWFKLKSGWKVDMDRSFIFEKRSMDLYPVNLERNNSLLMHIMRGYPGLGLLGPRTVRPTGMLFQAVMTAGHNCRIKWTFPWIRWALLNGQREMMLNMLKPWAVDAHLPRDTILTQSEREMLMSLDQPSWLEKAALDPPIATKLSTLMGPMPTSPPGEGADFMNSWWFGAPKNIVRGSKLNPVMDTEQLQRFQQRYPYFARQWMLPKLTGSLGTIMEWVSTDCHRWVHRFLQSLQTIDVDWIRESGTAVRLESLQDLSMLCPVHLKQLLYVHGDYLFGENWFEVQSSVQLKCLEYGHQEWQSMLDAIIIQQGLGAEMETGDLTKESQREFETKKQLTWGCSLIWQ